MKRVQEKVSRHVSDKGSRFKFQIKFQMKAVSARVPAEGSGYRFQTVSDELPREVSKVPMEVQNSRENAPGDVFMLHASDPVWSGLFICKC